MSDDLFDSREVPVGLGHNSRTGPSGLDALGEQLLAAIPNIPNWLRARHALIINRMHDLKEAVNELPRKLQDDEDAEKASDLRKQIIAANKAADAVRIADKKAFDEPGRVIHQFWTKRMDASQPGLADLDKLLKDYLREKQAKAEAAAAKEAEKQRAAAEKAIAKGKEPPPVVQAKPVAPTRVHGDQGSSTSTRKVWTFKDLDRAVINLEALRPYLTQDAIESAVRQYIRNGGRELTGVTIFEDISITTR